MNIFLSGASGFIGGHILSALSAQGERVTCLLRPASAARSHIERLPGVRMVEGEWTEPANWLRELAGHQALVNAVGIIRETRGASFAQIHTITPITLFDAAVRVGVSRIVQISALGADEGATSPFHLSKRAADQFLLHLSTSSVILRPSLVYGPADHSMAFFSRLARLPLTPVPGDGCYRVQPLYVRDLARAVLIALQSPDFPTGPVDLGGGEVLTFNAMLDLLARQQGNRRGARKVHIPWKAISLLALATELAGGHGPITRDELSMLRRENFTRQQARFSELFGFEPLPFRQGLVLRESRSDPL